MSSHARKGVCRAAVVLLFFAACPPTRADEPAPQPADSQSIEQWVKELDSDLYSTRQAAHRKLLEAGRPVVTALAEAAGGGSLEVTTQSIDILRKLFQSKDEETIAAAKAALEVVAKGENQAAARRARDVLEPPVSPNLRRDGLQRPALVPGVGGIRINGGAIQIQGGIQIGGGGRVFRIQANNANGAKSVEVDENGKKTKIEEDNSGITVTVTEKVDGKEKAETFKAKDADELQKKHPEAHKLYVKYGANQNGVVIGNIQVQGQGVPVPLPAFPLPAVPIPGLQPQAGKQAAEEIASVQKLLAELAANLKQSAGGEQAALKKAVEQATEKLDESNRLLEVTRRKLAE